MKFSLLRRFREHRIFAATPEVARQIEAFGERFAELAEECFVALTTEPFPATQKGGKWGLHLRLRDNKDIVGDAEALLAVADGDVSARKGKVAAIGFCMSGGLTIALAKAMPDRVAAAASIHGAWLVRDTPDSPHLDLDGVQAEIYFAWCDNDATAPVDTIKVMTDALDAAGVAHTVDFFTDAEHGFAPAGPRYNRAASELHWERVHSLLTRNL